MVSKEKSKKVIRNEAFPVAFIQFSKQLRNMREWFHH